MKISIVHSYYSAKEASGENVVVDAQVAALASAGYEVQLVARRTDDELRGRAAKLGAAMAVASGYGASPLDALTRFKPDVVHVHNLFPNWAWRWLKEWEGPLVATLHNFRPLCAAGTLFRDGHICFECLETSTAAAVRHGCYRNSALASVPLAIQNRGTPSGHPLLRRADRLIVLSSRAAEIYGDVGAPADKIRVVPNFVGIPETVWNGSASSRRQEWLFVGRNTPEKGLERLLHTWPASVPLGVIGESNEVASSSGRDLSFATFYGRRKREEVRDLIARSKGVVIPSRWFEGLPTVYLEAISTGTPVLALTGNSAADAAEEDGAGVVVTDDDWESGIGAASSRWEALAAGGQAAFSSRYTESVWLEAVSAVYDSVVS